MFLAEQRGRFLFEVRPDLFPLGYLGDVELSLWARWAESKPRPT